MTSRFLPLAAAALLLSQAATAQTPPIAAPALAYSDYADLVIAAPVIADAMIKSVTRLREADAAGVPPGRARLYVEAALTALIRGAGGLPPRVGYLLDVPLDARGRVPQLKKARVLLFAGIPNGPPPVAGQLQLVAPDAQVPWTPGADASVRALARAALATDAPPRITGVGSAFHVAGALPGEGETQVFLQTADARPVSLSVLRRPGERPRWAVALSEIVDDAAGPPPRDTLLWYRLACALPAQLPVRSTAEAAPADAQQARADYAFVLGQLGPCGRTREATGNRQ